jgi:hypothetical protein
MGQQKQENLCVAVLFDLKEKIHLQPHDCAGLPHA